MCVRKGSGVLDTGSTRDTTDTDVDFAWKHAEVLLLERRRKRNWGEPDRSRKEGGAWRAAAELMSIKGWC